MQSFFAHGRFVFLNLMQLCTAASVVFGGAQIWLGAIPFLVFLMLDEFASDQTAPGYRQTWFFNLLLYLNLPILIALSIIYAFFLSENDPLGLIGVADAVLGVDLEAQRQAATVPGLIAAGLAIALFYGAAGINVAHELVHRLDRPFDRTIGRWLLAFSLDTTFSIEHIYGHHINVGTDKDPATARRGEYIIPFIVRSTIGGIASAFELEAARLRRNGRSPWSLRNRALRGQFMSITYCVGFYWLAGWVGAVVFLSLALHGKAYLEAVNYIEHYGLVRVPGTKVAPRHSWDCYQTISTVFLYNLTRHSDHHVNARKPFWEQEVQAGAPRMPHGYMTMILAAFIPSLWNRITGPVLAVWDANSADAQERAVLSDRGWLIAEKQP
jgi:alkane 1-monooxygenase